MKHLPGKTKDVKDNTAVVSISPSGETFPVPAPGDYEKEFKRIAKLARE
ncbi:MAG: hypothetical protein JRI38_00695, partial [Deltaproteobacteria bacterium]|nr:hypothetical protein [Deltaproteobacteria bacterium]